ncbi:MAG: FKBP-type peptidyl-prolyl cis-trans isomerase [Sphingobacteriaceae bacterium]|nr:FKBP-type peptidyl-prolyl cis-trans isomerase [Sphingobacteriaceae bacterium]
MIFKLINKPALQYLLCVFVIITLTHCNSKKNSTEYSYHAAGYYWKLISFTEDSNAYEKGQYAHVNAVFYTQTDSVFYDSVHDLRDRLFIRIDSLKSIHAFHHAISKCNNGDSIIILIPTKKFFNEQFGQPVPFFSERDSVIKIRARIKEILNQEAYALALQKIYSDEHKEILQYFGTKEEMINAKDSIGIYWVSKTDLAASDPVRYGDIIEIQYEGSFLDGRIIDYSPNNFTLKYGTPDQLVKGLNYVIGKLKIGEESKIILPSQLAFGESGSSNGSIPPFTPLHYKIRLINKK